MEDALVVGGFTFRSRLFVGTGKYKDLRETELATAVSGADVVTVALRRVNMTERGEGSLHALLKRLGVTILPNTAGCYTVEDALRTCRLARTADVAQSSGDRRREDALPRQRGRRS